MKCPKCGAHNTDGAEFCSLCHHSFVEKKVDDPILKEKQLKQEDAETKGIDNLKQQDNKKSFFEMHKNELLSGLVAIIILGSFFFLVMRGGKILLTNTGVLSDKNNKNNTAPSRVLVSPEPGSKYVFDKGKLKEIIVEIPDGFPKDISFYENAKIIGAQEGSNSTGTAYEIVMETNEPISRPIAFYKKALADLDYEISPIYGRVKTAESDHFKFEKVTTSEDDTTNGVPIKDLIEYGTIIVTEKNNKKRITIYLVIYSEEQRERYKDRQRNN